MYLGWTFLAAHPPSDEMRRVLSKRLTALIAANVKAWENEANFLSGDALPTHGFLSRADSIDALRTTVEKVIYPGFELHGIRPAPFAPALHES